MTADFFEKVLKGIKQDANMRATIGIGGAYSSLRDISQSYMGQKRSAPQVHFGRQQSYSYKD